MPCRFGTLRRLNCSCGKQTCTWAAMAPKPQQSCLTCVLSLAAGLLWNRLLSWIMLLLGFLWICQCMVVALVWLVGVFCNSFGHSNVLGFQHGHVQPSTKCSAARLHAPKPTIDIR